jgi:acyl-coenzyme A thioesterase PaaI-like protein
MRTFTTTLLFLAIISSGALSQIADGINYQAVALDAAGNKIVGTDASWNVLNDKQFNVRFSLHETNPDGTLLYQETHLAHTDPFGMFSLVIGHGVKTGGFCNKLTEIPWGRDKVFLKVEIDIARNQTYKVMDIQQMMAVPFAFHAGTAGAMSVIKADAGHDPDKPIFAVTNTKGDTVFAVFESGVIIGIDPDAPKGSRGGFAVGGFSSRKGGEILEYFRVDPGFIQVTIDDDPDTKGSRGGFAVGGFSSFKQGLQADYFHLTPGSAVFQLDNDYKFPDSKGSRGGFAVGGFSSLKGGIPSEYLRVTSDSVRVYIDDSDDSKGSRGGFAVGGFSSFKGEGYEYLRVDPGFIRLTIDDDHSKGSRGGFAVGGFSSARTKGTPNYFDLTPGGASFLSDMDYPVDLKGSRGGFAVGGFSSKKSTGVNDYLSLTAASSRVYIYDDPEEGQGGSFSVVERTGKKGEEFDVLYVAPDRTSVYLKENRKNSPDGFSVFNRDGDIVDRLFLGF